MGSVNGNGRNGDWKGRKGRLGRREAPRIESLERRMLLDGGGGNDVPSNFHPTTTDVYDVKNGPMAIAGQDLISIYKEYQQFRSTGNGGAFVSSKTGYVRFSGDYVGIDAHGWGDVNAYVSSLKNLGMKVEYISPDYHVVEGLFPIAQLPNLAGLPQTVDVAPIYTPLRAQQGKAANQGDQVLATNLARTQFNVNGRGVTVGVLSDSISKFQGALADSVRTGDLPNNVTVLQETPNATGTDEGRAMLEEIYDIAPGANLAFATADGGPASFAGNISALANFGAKVIVGRHRLPERADVPGRDHRAGGDERHQEQRRDLPERGGELGRPRL